MFGFVAGVGEDALEFQLAGGDRCVVERELCYDDPQVGDVCDAVADGGQWLLMEPLNTHRVVTCSRVQPQKGDVVVFEAPGGVKLRREASELGVEGHAEAQRLNVFRDRFKLVVDDSGMAVEVLWPEGGLAELRRLLTEREVEARLADVRRRADRDDVFVNPYTYVPFPAAPAMRRAPSGHERLGDGALCGWFDVDIELLSPLLIRFGADQGSLPRRSGRVFVPGSSLKGAVRSLHEALTGGCLRVVDLEHVPIYRDPVVVRGPEWTLGRVADVGANNRIEKVELCGKVVWVRASLLHEGRVLGGPAQTRTGARLSVDQWEKRNARDEATAASAGDGWVILVTDAGARRKDQPYYCAAGRLTGSFVNVSDSAWAGYLEAVDGANDLRVARRQDEDATTPRDELVIHDGVEIGYRHTAAKGFAVGDVLWVRKGPQEIEELALSYAWRTRGKGPVRKRVVGFDPCTSTDELCPSCRVFGSADPEGDVPGRRGIGEAARQDAYGGHVRVGDAEVVSGDEVRVVTERLAPMGQPRLGSGQFTLAHGGRLEPGSPSTREWGAAPDRQGLRQLRGRRMYWHGNPRDQEPRPRHRYRGHQSTEMASTVELAEPPATFRARIHFDGLTEDELGGLLAAVAPSLLLDAHRPDGFADDGRTAIRIGGGKPFGFGSAATTIVDLKVDDAASRYGGGPPPEVTTATAVEAFAASVAESLPDEVRVVWPALAAVLNTGHVNGKRIWYPPGATWDQVGTRAFDEPYAFFARSAGTDVGQHAGDMVPLPEPAGVDQYLDMPTERDRS